MRVLEAFLAVAQRDIEMFDQASRDWTLVAKNAAEPERTQYVQRSDVYRDRAVELAQIVQRVKDKA